MKFRCILRILRQYQKKTNRWCFQKTFMGHLWNRPVWRKIEFSEKIIVLSCFSIPKKRRKISLGCFLISKKSKEHFELFFKFERIETKTFLGCFSFWSKKKVILKLFSIEKCWKARFCDVFHFWLKQFNLELFFKLNKTKRNTIFGCFASLIQTNRFGDFFIFLEKIERGSFCAITSF